MPGGNERHDISRHSFLGRKPAFTSGLKIPGGRVHGAEGGSRLGHVKSDAMRGLHHAAHRPVVTLPKRREFARAEGIGLPEAAGRAAKRSQEAEPQGRSRSGDRGELPHAATKGFARSYRINLRLVPDTTRRFYGCEIVTLKYLAGVDFMSSTGCQFCGERDSVPYTVYLRADEPRSGFQLK